MLRRPDLHLVEEVNHDDDHGPGTTCCGSRAAPRQVCALAIMVTVICLVLGTAIAMQAFAIKSKPHVQPPCFYGVLLAENATTRATCACLPQYAPLKRPPNTTVPPPGSDGADELVPCLYKRSQATIAFGLTLAGSPLGLGYWYIGWTLAAALQMTLGIWVTLELVDNVSALQPAFRFRWLASLQQSRRDAQEVRTSRSCPATTRALLSIFVLWWLLSLFWISTGAIRDGNGVSLWNDW